MELHSVILLTDKQTNGMKNNFLQGGNQKSALRRVQILYQVYIQDSIEDTKTDIYSSQIMIK